MSAELKAKFTADTSDFNGAVQQIDRKLKGVGKLGQSFGLGRVGNGVGDFLSGIGGLGLAGGGAGALAFGGMSAVRAFGQVLDERAKALEQGLPVHELTGFGRYIEKVRNGFEVTGRVFSELPKLFIEGVESYQNAVLGDAQRAQKDYNKALESAAQARREEAETTRLNNEANARLEEWLRKEREAIGDDVKRAQQRQQNFTGSVEAYKSDTIISALEKSGNPMAAEAIRLSRQFNETLGLTGAWNQFTPEQVLREFGPMIQDRINLNGMGGNTSDKLNEVLQSSPELSDRLRRIGGGGGEAYGSTTQVFKDSLSVERQQLQKLTTIAEKIGGGTLTTR